MAAEHKVDEVKTGSGGVQVNVVYKEIRERHKELMKKMSKMDLSNYQDNASLVELKSFSGYYSVQLNTPALEEVDPLLIPIQAFISVDTNIGVQIDKSGRAVAVTTVDIIYPVLNKDNVVTGYESHTFDSSKDTFKDNKLDIKNDKLVLSVEFKRQSEEIFMNGTSTIITSSMMGTITTNGVQYLILGGTENNAIPYTTFKGEYYEEIPFWTLREGGPGKELVFIVPVLRIGDNWKIEYDFGSNDGKLSQVTSFCYNLNMYYFSFITYEEAPPPAILIYQVKHSLIMGTAAAKGLACNNMVTFKKARSLVTIPFVQPGFPSWALMSSKYSQLFNTHKEMKNKYEGVSYVNNPNSSALAPYSGYYKLNFENEFGCGNKDDAKGAFLSIQANLYYLNGSVSDYTIDIGLSLNGKSSLSFKFDTSMTFDVKSKTLIIPGQLNVSFERKYDKKNGSLVQLKGSLGPFGNVNITGFNRFNPVSLGAFTGKYYNESNENDLVLSIKEVLNPILLNTTLDVEYYNKKFSSFIYVPIMYILAQVPSKGCKDYVLMSLGTNGVHGVTGIITQFTNGTPGVPIIAQAYASTASSTTPPPSDNDNLDVAKTKFVIPYPRRYVIKFFNDTGGYGLPESVKLTLESYHETSGQSVIAQYFSATPPPQNIDGGQTVEWGGATTGPYPIGIQGSATYSVSGMTGKIVGKITVNWDMPYSAKPSFSGYSNVGLYFITYVPGTNNVNESSVTFTLSTAIGDPKKNKLTTLNVLHNIILAQQRCGKKVIL